MTAFVVVLTLGILALAGLTLDGGQALAATVKAHGQAEAAARAGAQAIDLAVYRNSDQLRLVPGRAVTAARRYLATVGASGTVTASGDTVTVTVTGSHATQLLGVVGISSLPIHATATAQPHRGVVTIEP